MAIYDCFTFFNELDLLEIRLTILDPYIDYFVLVESNKTHHGNKKPYYYFDSRERYKKFENKIIYIQVNDTPKYKGETDMGIVNFLRNCIMRGLVDKARPDDYILVSDVDEIPNPNILLDLKKRKVNIYANRGSWKRILRQHMRILSMFSNEFMGYLKEHKTFTADELMNYTPIGLEYDLFYYFINCKSKTKWLGPYITKYAHMMMPHEPRELSYQCQLPIIQNAGWHFSYLGGFEAVKAKLAALSDPDPELEKRIKEVESNDDYINKCLEKGIDILGRKGKQFEYVFIDAKKIELPNIENIIKKYPMFYRKI